MEVVDFYKRHYVHTEHNNDHPLSSIDTNDNVEYDNSKTIDSVQSRRRNVRYVSITRVLGVMTIMILIIILIMIVMYGANNAACRMAKQ